MHCTLYTLFTVHCTVHRVWEPGSKAWVGQFSYLPIRTPQIIEEIRAGLTWLDTTMHSIQLGKVQWYNILYYYTGQWNILYHSEVLNSALLYWRVHSNIYPEWPTIEWYCTPHVLSGLLPIGWSSQYGPLFTQVFALRYISFMVIDSFTRVLRMSELISNAVQGNLVSWLGLAGGFILSVSSADQKL